MIALGALHRLFGLLRRILLGGGAVAHRYLRAIQGDSSPPCCGPGEELPGMREPAAGCSTIHVPVTDLS